MQEADVVLPALRALTFRGRISPETASAAVQLLRRSSLFGPADLLEASIRAWNALDWKTS